MSKINEEMDLYMAKLRAKKHNVSMPGTTIMLGIGCIGSWMIYHFWGSGHPWLVGIGWLLALYCFGIVTIVYTVK